MSHSRIFQLSTEVIDQDEYISEDYFYDDFVGTIADYVSGDTDRNGDIEWFLSVVGEFGATLNSEDESLIFNQGFKENYFRERLDSLKQMVQDVSLSAFSGNFGDATSVEEFLAVYRIEKLVNDTNSFYIYNNAEGGYGTLDHFVRNLEEGKKYFFGATIDYHF